MNTVFKLFLSMSFSGAALILALLAGKRIWRDKISRQWQYYIWLVVIFRLLLPFAPERNLMAAAGQAAEQALSGTILSVLPRIMTDKGDVDIFVSSRIPDSENATRQFWQKWGKHRRRNTEKHCWTPWRQSGHTGKTLALSH